MAQEQAWSIALLGWAFIEVSIGLCIVKFVWWLTSERKYK